MAFQRFNSPSAANTVAADNNPNKAVAFLNLSLPANDGTKKRIGAQGLALRLSREDEVQLAEWLAADANNVNKLKEKLIVEFVMNTPNRGGGFALD